ncbi:formate dehydrogenase accessory sulfurtransferase FdhD [Rhodoferax sp.]|uniref:formate dehydrogenase accessory sulfurtransferase FdhD n=1 Tax=Rhodoferax sp. TaxID=50421 RepID=UPI00284122F7|nr:formate dehydrogenase accessory sulfurtransferase FdhD [Rhodoferax sp.]MDR3370663.1 formate dehydrogenase accessory sulfurtransferase FdhD [Rhodoferax sp.]
MDMPVTPAFAGQAWRTVEVSGVRDQQPMQWRDCVAEEVPVALEFNGISHAVMMASPADFEDFAYGFALTEGVVDNAAQIFDCDWSCTALGYTVHLTIAASCFARLKGMRRNLTGRTGCGLCGTESLTHAVRQIESVQTSVRFSAAAVRRALAALRDRQVLLSISGATHAAAWCSGDGQIKWIREDVGRHNALDKLLGALSRAGCDASCGFVVVTSRASFEMVQKTAAAGVALLVAVSGVTSLAVEVAQRTDLVLAGFARGGDISLYSHPQRFELD